MYWNPGGISQLKQPELLVNHTQWLADIGFTYIGYVLPTISSGVIGFNVTAITMSPMEVTNYDYEEGTGETFKAGSYAVGMIYSRQLTDRFGIGGKYKICY